MAIQVGTFDDDVLVGGEKTDLLHGLPGNDSLFGYGGNDSLFGLDGDDRLIGGDGRDGLNGGEDDDRLIGNGGNDLLTGGDGSDTFVFETNGGIDRVLDFEQGLELADRLDFSRVAGVDDIGDLTIITRANSVVIETDAGMTVILRRFDGTLTADDFVF